MTKRIILASTSSYRASLLRGASLVFESMAPEVNEVALFDSDPKVTAQIRARAKAQSIQIGSGNVVVIGADQTVSINGRRLDKVHSEDDARLVLRELSGKDHFLHSAVCLLTSDQGVIDFCVDVAMSMRKLSDTEIDAYINSGEWQGSVGCYKIEGIGINLFSNIGGDQSSIIGLPLLPLLMNLRKLGINPLDDASVSS